MQNRFDEFISEKEDPTLWMLVCLEFEVKALLGYTNLDVILEKVKAMPNASSKIYETIAGECMKLGMIK